jgi:uncharacterized membrane protein YphA (DoxX/SURF4 family)
MNSDRTQVKGTSMKFQLPRTLLYLMTLLRVAIGWHFLYEGIDKMYTPDWSAASYLDTSRWIFSPLFRLLTLNPVVLNAVDIFNIAALIIIGLALILGIRTKSFSIAGTSLLLLYYLAHPPFIGLDFGVPAEGSYLWINKNIIEMIALLILAFTPGESLPGLDYLLMYRVRNKHQKIKTPEQFKSLFSDQLQPAGNGRRDFLKGLATLPFLGAFACAVIKKQAWASIEEKHLLDTITSASVKSFQFTNLKDLQGKVPHRKIGKMPLSRMILGGNLIGGWAHARDLLYVSKLVKAYHHRDKVFETLLLAEKCGINALLTNPLLSGIIQEYWRRNIGKIQFISDCGGDDLLERIQISIDAGASSCYVQGEVADRLVREGRIDLIAQGLRLIWKNRLPAGIGAHRIETIQACVEYGLEPDYWMKTLHHHNYWSVQITEEHDNVFCRQTELTIEFMKTLNQPWIAFKVLAAGAIPPEEGFRYVFENGADFICVGMYDFQIVDDVNLLLTLLNQNLPRERPWMA